jgi:hypothetical protein
MVALSEWTFLAFPKKSSSSKVIDVQELCFPLSQITGIGPPIIDLPLTIENIDGKFTIH